MRILVLGGTQFLGRHVVETLVARGHDVTLFNRGRTAPGLFPALRRLQGDRDGGLAPVAALVAAAAPGRAFDAVIDVNGYVPRVVRQSCELLRDGCARYLFVSTISVYDGPPVQADESAARATLADPATEDVPAHYGALKAACEDVVQQAFGRRATVVRPGLIVGPHDPTGRFTYWPTRLARGGTVLAPEPRDAPVQVVDARDLAAFIVGLVEADTGGVFHATGPDGVLTLGDLLDRCRAVAGAPADLRWVPADRLIEAGVAPWTGLPLWLGAEPDPLMQMSIARARAAGLTLRPIEQTLADTLAWATGPEGRPPQGAFANVGLTPEREAALLAQLAAPSPGA